MSEKTILDLYRHEYEHPRPDHYTHATLEGSRTLSTEEFFSKTAALAEALGKLGVTHGDRFILLSDNRPEWHMVDLALADLGAISVPVYGNLTPTQLEYQANDSGAMGVITDSAEQMAKFLEVRGSCPDLKHFIQMDGEPADGVLSLDEVVSGSEDPGNGDRFWERATRVTEDDLLTLIYTSGTTGDPKGVMLTHRNLVQNVMASSERAILKGEYHALEFLPLCHVFERMIGYLYMYRGLKKTYCSVYIVGDLVADIAPNVFAAVPRFYEKVYDKIHGMVSTAPAIRRALFNWAVEQGRKAYPKRLAGGKPGGLFYSLADSLVLSKIRGALGGQVVVCVSGGAPLPQYVAEFFHSIGVNIIEGYGLTETSPVIAVAGMGPGENKLGTVGRPISNVKAKIAPDGELVVKGPSVMKGYWNKPEKTAEVFDEEGFFHTGDIAVIDEDGFLKITDRKKDLIVTAGGKNVAPQPIESTLKSAPFVDNVVLIGDRRKYIVALFSPNTEEIERWATEQGIAYEAVEDLYQHPKILAELQKIVDATNKGLARYEQVKKFAVLPMMLSVEGGHLTPTLKVKRRVVEKEFADTIEALYAE
ncbi:MAG: long-chain fatty acid--CoA ligase [Acidobacteria bacterium]|nr:long-chain fatty acid--CoA ligase [Acidobacteriota bacterium]